MEDKSFDFSQRGPQGVFLSSRSLSLSLFFFCEQLSPRVRQRPRRRQSKGHRINNPPFFIFLYSRRNIP